MQGSQTIGGIEMKLKGSLGVGDALAPLSALSHIAF